MDGRIEEVRDSIRSRIWSGYYDADGVFEGIIDDVWFDADDQDKKLLRDEIQREFQKKREAEQAWPDVSSCDRLDEVFESLRSKDILTQHRCGLTIQDGLHVIGDLYREAGGKRSGLVGYCFYHLQDMDAAMWEDIGLWLAYGSFPPNREQAVLTGQRIQEEFERAGLDVEWDGTADSRLLLKNFRWQRRSPGTEPSDPVHQSP
jgi:hypothetical protein